MKNNQIKNTNNSEYTQRLINKQRAWWKRLIDVQAPYRWNIRRLQPGYTLDIGCGIGRNLLHLNGHGVGVDHSLSSVEFARRQGLTAFTPDEFVGSGYDVNQHYDTLLLAHVAEHMTQKEAIEILQKYILYIKPRGRLIMITPQEAGYKSDATHVEFMDFSKHRAICKQLQLDIIKEYSFPFPRFIGHVFTYNEFITISRKSRDI